MEGENRNKNHILCKVRRRIEEAFDKYEKRFQYPKDQEVKSAESALAAISKSNLLIYAVTPVALLAAFGSDLNYVRIGVLNSHDIFGLKLEAWPASVVSALVLFVAYVFLHVHLAAYYWNRKVTPEAFAANIQTYPGVGAIYYRFINNVLLVPGVLGALSYKLSSFERWETGFVQLLFVLSIFVAVFSFVRNVLLKERVSMVILVVMMFSFSSVASFFERSHPPTPNINFNRETRPTAADLDFVQFIAWSQYKPIWELVLDGVFRKRTLELKNVYLEGNEQELIDLRFAPLKNAHITESEMIRANLSGADLYCSYLSQNNFTGSVLGVGVGREAYVTHAVNFSAATIKDSFFDNIHSRQPTFLYSTIINTTFNQGAVLHGAQFVSAEVLRSEFIGASLIESSFIGSKVEKNLFNGADMRGVTFARENQSWPTIIVGNDFSGTKGLTCDHFEGVVGWQFNKRDIQCGVPFPIEEEDFYKIDLTGMKIDDEWLSVKVHGERAYRSYEIFRCDQLKQYTNWKKAKGKQIVDCQARETVTNPEKAQG